MTKSEWRPLHYAAVLILATVWLVAAFGYSVAHPASNEITGTPRPTDGPTATMTGTATATARPTATESPHTPTLGDVYLPVVIREGAPLPRMTRTPTPAG